MNCLKPGGLRKQLKAIQEKEGGQNSGSGMGSDWYEMGCELEYAKEGLERKAEDGGYTDGGEFGTCRRLML